MARQKIKPSDCVHLPPARIAFLQESLECALADFTSVFRFCCSRPCHFFIAEEICDGLEECSVCVDVQSIFAALYPEEMI